MAFGRNINAGTSFDETVYNLSDVPVRKPGLIDTCLMILADWSDFLTLSEEEINKGEGGDHGRVGKRDASWRMMTQMLPVLFEGSQYAVRDIIGDTAVIKNFSPETLREIYHDWYPGLDLQAIVVVGDVDVDAVEAKIREIFSPISGSRNPIAEAVNRLVPKSGTRYLLLTDPEASETSVSLFTIDPHPDTVPRDLDYIRDGYVIALMNSMMSNRFNEIVQKGTPPFVFGSLSYGSFLARDYNALTLSATARDDEESKAFEAALTELERVKRHGFTKGELERTKATMLANFENRYKQKDKISNDSWASRIRDHFLTGEPVPSMDLQYEYYKQILPQITLAEVTERLKGLV